MREGRPSRTAAQNALFRALESARPPRQRLFNDPQAAALLPPRYRAVLALARLGWLRERVLLPFIDYRWPGVRSSVVARTRLIDDMTADLAPEVDQVVILGAGLDTRALRLASLADLPVFEVDHPDTQRNKQDALGRVAAERRAWTFVAFDFDHGDLDASLSRAGLAPSPTLVIWEGVSNYLSAIEVDETLRWFARRPRGSQLIYTYIDDAVLADASTYDGANRVLAAVQRSGEAMTFGMSPDEVADYLADRGMTLESDVGAAEYRSTYFGRAAESMTGHEFYRVAHARTRSDR